VGWAVEVKPIEDLHAWNDNFDLDSVGLEKVNSLPMLLEDGSVNASIAFFTISYVVINVWTILQVESPVCTV
jgi:hypothetical protein